MSERYKRLSLSAKPLYISGAPLVIAASALLKDSQTGQVIAQVKFLSLDSRTITAVFADFTAQDVSSQPLAGVSGFQYLDLHIQSGQEFGSNIPVVLPDTRSRGFEVHVSGVIFADGSAWYAPEAAQFKTIPEQQRLSDFLGQELTDQYKRDVSPKAEYVPQEYADLWLCSCGSNNKGHNCTQCGVARTKVFGAFDSEILSANFAEYKTRLNAQIERQAAAHKAATKKGIIFGSAVVVIAAVFTIIFGVPLLRYNYATKLLTFGKFDEAGIAFDALGDYKDSANMVTEAKYQKAQSLLSSGEYDRACNTFSELNMYKDSVDMVTEAKYQKAQSFFSTGDHDSALSSFMELGKYKVSDDMVMELNRVIRELVSQYYGRISSGGGFAAGIKLDYTIGLKSDGTVIGIGLYKYNRDDVAAWRDIVAISAGVNHIIGLKSDGTVLALGDNEDKQCEVANWRDIVTVSAGYFHTVGLKSNGKVIAVGFNGFDQCDVSDWSDIVDVAAGYFHTIGLKSGGTVIAEGINEFGQCKVTKWRDIAAVSTDVYHTIGLKLDGTAIAVGLNSSGQCDVADWRNIVAVSAGNFHTVGLKSDGTVVATGENFYGQCDLAEWRDIVAVSAGNFHTVGLKSDGTVVAAGLNNNGQCDVAEWNLW